MPDGSESFTTTRSEKKQRAVSSAISLLTNKKTRDLIMILNSKRFVEIFVSTLEEKKHHEAKLKEGLKDLAIKHMELQNSLSSVWPKQEAAVAKTRELKKVFKDLRHIVFTFYRDEACHVGYVICNIHAHLITRTEA
ncbi:unnamed protein product [Lactuca virosa]|uniref:Uncharacterized protein n=1 Tax=Lactuca virosa TaxID=75947 RepID=A0AAU9P3I3_9ASTR|nr:unnamed protein product [Lactuca virosa]